MNAPTKYYGYEEESVGEVRGFHLFLTVKVCECGLSIIREKVCIFCVHVYISSEIKSMTYRAGGSVLSLSTFTYFNVFF